MAWLFPAKGPGKFKDLDKKKKKKKKDKKKKKNKKKAKGEWINYRRLLYFHYTLLLEINSEI